MSTARWGTLAGHMAKMDACGGGDGCGCINLLIYFAELCNTLITFIIENEIWVEPENQK